MRTVNLAEAPQAILHHAVRQGRPVILLDGGSGAGKTSLAALVAAHWRETRNEELQVVSLDDVYPGWSGLAAGSNAVQGILASPGGYRRWDWENQQSADWIAIDPGRPILVEGCGALTHESARLATCRVWLELEKTVRKCRALARDKGGYDPYWDIWAAQEQLHWRKNQPWSLADISVQD